MTEHGGQTLGLHHSHVTRTSDASTYDTVCVRCGATDRVPGGWGDLAYPCPNALSPLNEGKITDGYVLTKAGRLPNGDMAPEGIRCNRCGRISFNPNDVRELYCGVCHAFHD